MMMDEKEKISVLGLGRDQDFDTKLLRIRVGWSLHILVAPGIYAENVRVFTDFPAEGQNYARNKFRELQWTYRGKYASRDPDRRIELALTASGPFRIRWTFGSDGSTAVDNLAGHGFFVVEPDLGYSPDSINCQTVITKQLGPLPQWHRRLLVAHKTGYNMIHFTPPQQLGSSRSAYSISNQMRLDSLYLPTGYAHKDVVITYTNRSKQQKQLKVDSSFLELRRELQHLKHEQGVLSIVDVVWNHTSFDTPWLIQVQLSHERRIHTHTYTCVYIHVYVYACMCYVYTLYSMLSIIL